MASLPAPFRLIKAVTMTLMVLSPSRRPSAWRNSEACSEKSSNRRRLRIRAVDGIRDLFSRRRDL